MNQSEIAITIALTGFGIGLIGRVWQVSTSVADIRHSLQLQNMKLENLALLHESAFNGFKERIEHSTNRLKTEISTIDRRLEDTEAFLTKTTDFTQRR